MDGDFPFRNTLGRLSRAEDRGKRMDSRARDAAGSRTSPARAGWTGRLTGRAESILAVFKSNIGSLVMRFGGLGEQMDVRRLTVFVARWLMDGSVPARGRREWEWAWARRSVAGIGLPVSPKPIERREFSSDTAAALSCPGPDGGAAGSGLSGLFRHPGFPMRRRANGGRASAAISGTGGRARALARSGRCKWVGLLVTFAALLSPAASGRRPRRPPSSPTPVSPPQAPSGASVPASGVFFTPKRSSSVRAPTRVAIRSRQLKSRQIVSRRILRQR